MEWTVLSCVLLAIFVSVSAKPEDSPSEQGITMQPDPAAVLNSGGVVSKGALLMLHDNIKQGDSLLKERLNFLHGHLKEQIKDGDSLLKERISNGMANVREELKEGDERLKEELDNDVAWLKGKVEKEESRLKEEVTKMEAKVKEEMAEWKDHLEHSVKQWKESSRFEEDHIRQEMSAMQQELNDTKTLLRITQETLQSTQADLQSTQADLQAAQEKVRSHDVALGRTREQPHDEVQGPTPLKTGLQTAGQGKGLPENSTCCPDGWTSHEDFCFLINSHTYTWFHAKVVCEMFGGYLADDTSPSRHQFLTDWMESLGLTSNYVWIGVHDLVGEGVFFWSHNGQRANVTFWDQGQPNNAKGNQDCVCLHQRHWHDLNCEDNSAHFICEKPASKEMIG